MIQLGKFVDQIFGLGRKRLWPPSDLVFWMGFDNILVGVDKKIEGPCQHGRYETLDPSPETPCHGRE